MTYAASHRLCKAGEKHLIRKEWAYIMKRLHAHPLQTDINHSYDAYEMATVASTLELRLFHQLKPFTTDIGRFSRIDPKQLPCIRGLFKDLPLAKANLTLQKGMRLNRFTGEYPFPNISYAQLPQIEKELSELLKRGTNNVL